MVGDTNTCYGNMNQHLLHFERHPIRITKKEEIAFGNEMIVAVFGAVGFLL